MLLIDIGCAGYLTHLEAWDYFLLIRKHKYFLPVRGNLVVVCNLTDVQYSVALNGVKWVVTHEWMTSVFEILFLFWFVVMSWFSSWDEMDVHVELIADDVWSDEDDKTGFLSYEVDIFDQLYWKERPISLPMVQISTIKQKYEKWG